jgi:hypothetical protein
MTGISEITLFSKCGRRGPDLKGGAMNRIEKKEIAPDAAKLFEQEVLQLEPDIPRKELCDMVDDYIYYQTDGVSKEEAHAIVDITCRLSSTEAQWRFTLGNSPR